ncbi:glutaredoxin family protein [Photobacterium alginatilyticum]|uniref:Glutaredoxin n=1 Tax=Photobacterium alginatilyticum TaxID=1775171 RepID=A0ABW9YFW7_9GAMM|nr:glutaredoxin [Photobacterium alginatilyticum]NBI52692.1 glutaredoxin [Photobacterium alginatilyticum]
MIKSNNIKALSLYHYQGCPFCAATRKAIKQTKLNIEYRDIRLQPQNRSDLINGGGKPQVPCLRIEKENGQHVWLYESTDIIHFLRSYDAQLEKQAESNN